MVITVPNLWDFSLLSVFRQDKMLLLLIYILIILGRHDSRELFSWEFPPGSLAASVGFSGLWEKQASQAEGGETYLFRKLPNGNNPGQAK